MTAQFPFEAWARPSKDAFEFWISFFPTAPLFGVEWRYADMLNPAMSPFMQPGAVPFPMAFPGTSAAAAAARPGELDSPARADDRAERPLARATEAAAGVAEDAGRLAAETGRAAARMAEAAVNPAPTAPAVENFLATGGNAAQKPVTANEAAGERSGDVSEKPGFAGRAAEATANSAQSAEPRFTALADGQVKGRPDTTPTGATAVDDAAQVEAGAEAVDAAIAAAPRPDVLLDARPDDPDDLTTLKGVGPGLQRQLNDLGVWKLGQLARMTDADLAWIDANLTSFKGRCFRDDWIGQAKARLAR